MSARKATGVPVPKVNPLEAEAKNEFVEVEFEGLKVSIPTGDEIPVAAISAFEKGHIVTFVELMVGDQYEKLAPKVPTLGALRAFATVLAEAMGSSVGE